MRKVGSAVLGVALAAVAVGTWSKSLFVTDAAALATRPGAPEQTAAAAVAARFPTDREMFRNPGRQPDGLVAPSLKGDRQGPVLYPCGANVVFAPHACFATEIKPKPAAPAARPDATLGTAPPREVTVERRPAANAPELVRTAAVAPLVRAAIPDSCRQNLPAATARMERILAQLKATRAKPDAEACATYRAGFFEMVQVRDVTALCRTGAERASELTRIDGAVDTINGAIAQSCDSI
jgi:hypothetical protein